VPFASTLQKSQGESGWDVFSLAYRVELPISVVLHDKAMKLGYYRMFHFLWRLKRVDHLLSRVWQAHVADPMHGMIDSAKYTSKQNHSRLFDFAQPSSLHL
jgi:hypothetical protein